MHSVLVFVHQQRAVCDRHNIRNLIGRCADNGLQAHLSQKADAFNNAVTVHLIERLVKHRQSNGIAEAGGVVDAIKLGE